jgi:hypothetical protein
MRFRSRLAFSALLAVSAVPLTNRTAVAVDTMADWVGLNTVTPTFAPDNNYGIISPTSVGGKIQSKINFASSLPAGQNANAPFVYLADQALEGPALDFTSTLHMEGTVTFNSPMATEPNILFGWYNSEDTRHRIGFGISNLAVSEGGAVADRLRFDFGYAATGGNSFLFVSDDGTASQTSNNSLVPNGTYSFSFDYVPAASGAGGTMSATVGTGGQYFRTVTPLATAPWDTDFFALDRFGLVQRTTTQTTQLGSYNVVFSNVSYTGGTLADVAIPGDFDDDGFVDADDLTIWKNNYGASTGATSSTGDADFDGDVDGADFLAWQRNFTSMAVAAVPEPASVALTTVAMVYALTMRRRQSAR